MAQNLPEWQVNIGSGNGLVPLGNKPLPEPMLTQKRAAIWCNWAILSWYIFSYVIIYNFAAICDWMKLNYINLCMIAA